MKNLTERQKEILDLIKSYIGDYGFPPTRADISKKLGFKSANAAEQHLRAIEKKGYIKILSGASRGIVLNEQEEKGIPVIGLVAAGGPILHPSIEAMVVCPICPMSLSSRPIIVPAESNLLIRHLSDKYHQVKLWKDGAGGIFLKPGDTRLVKRSKNYALMLILKSSPSYYRTITHKLHWAGSLPSKN